MMGAWFRFLGYLLLLYILHSKNMCTLKFDNAMRHFEYERQAQSRHLPPDPREPHIRPWKALTGAAIFFDAFDPDTAMFI